VAVECVVRAVHRGGMHFTGVVGAHTVEMDYPLDPGVAGDGPRPMEMLLASLAACAGGSVVALLRRGGHQFDGLTVTARGHRRSEHPTVFTEIAVEFAFRGTVDQAAVDRAISQAETRVCPVWTMLKASTPVRTTVQIGADVPEGMLPTPPKPEPPPPRKRTLADVMGAFGFFLAIIAIVVGLVQIFRSVGRLFR
jgi:putative redox protein